MRRADLKRHLVIGAEIDRLHIAPRPQIPEVEMVAVFVREQVFGTIPFSNCGGSPHSLDTI